MHILQLISHYFSASRCEVRWEVGYYRLRSSQLRGELDNQIGNFELKFPTSTALNFATSHLCVNVCNLPAKWWSPWHNLGKVVRGFQTIRNSAAVKFTEKDSFKYCLSVRTYRKRSTRSWWEQVTNSKNGWCCLVHGVLQTSKAKYVCCVSTKAVNRKSGCLTRHIKTKWCPKLR